MIYLEPTDLAFMEADQLIQEGIDFQKIGSTIKEKVQKFIEWLIKCAKYVRSLIARHRKLKRAEKVQKEMDDLMKREGWNIRFDDIEIPGDDYENMFEAAEEYLIGDLTESDIKTFAKNVILNKKVLLNLATKLVPGVSTAQLAISLPKTIAMLTPIVMDFIDTSKEIVLLKKKYAGKTKKIKNPDGTICEEMPAEAFITIDKYKKLADRILDISLKENSHKGEQVAFKLNSTEDLIRLAASISTKMENNTEFDNLLRKMDDFMNTVNVEAETKFDETSLSVNYKNMPNSCIECMMMMANMMCDTASGIGTFYVNNVECTLNVKPIISEIQPVLADTMNLAINAIKDINTLESTGEKALIVANKIINKYAGKVVSIGIKADNNAKKRGITNEELKKKLLVPARNMKESYDLYTESRKPEKVIDGYLGDLPENLQSDVMEIHKLVIKTVNDILNTRDYSDLKNDKWAKEQLEEFCAMPADKSDIGSIRVYQRGKKYRCMIQLTGHFTNHMEDFNQELMHEFIKNVFVTVRPKIRKKYDFTITNEGDHGNPFEGFDVFPNPKLVEEIWNKLKDRTIRTIIEESVDEQTGHVLMLTFSNYINEMVMNHPNIEENINMIDDWNSGSFSDDTMIESSNLFKITPKSLDTFLEQCEIELLRDDITVDDTIMYIERLERVQGLQEYLSEDDAQEFTEKSHGKLKFDYRRGYDTKTGHQILLVYSLDNVTITYPGHTYKIDNFKGISQRDDSNPALKAANDDVQKNITTKGNMDHQSYGQKLLAIKDLVTGEQLQEVDYIGLYNVSGVSPERMQLNLSDRIWSHILDKNDVFHIKVGDIETPEQRSFKSTKFFKPDIQTQRDNLFDIKGNLVDKNQSKMIVAEQKLKYGRGTKLDDMSVSYQKSFGNNLLYKHPSKKDVSNQHTELNAANKDKKAYIEEVFSMICNKVSRNNTIKSSSVLFYNELMKHAKYIDIWNNDNNKLKSMDMSNFRTINCYRSSELTKITAADINSEVKKYRNKAKHIRSLEDEMFKPLADTVVTDLKIATKLRDLLINKHMVESTEFTESSIQYNRVSGHIKDLPNGFQKFALEINEEILEAVLDEMQRHKDFDSIDDDDVKDLINWMDAKSNEDDYGYFFIEKDKDDKTFAGEMRLFPKTGKEFGYISKKLEDIWDRSLKYVFDKKHSAINKKDSTKKLTLVTDENIYTLVFVFSREYAEKLYNYCINPRRYPLMEAATNDTEKYWNVDMTETEAKKTLGTLTAGIINDKKPISQYTANIYANIITKNLLPLWSKGYRKLSITLDDNKKFSIFEFKIPTMTQDFVARFVNGRETVNGLLHRNPEIRIRMSASLFKTIQDRNDAFNFFKAAIKYYDTQAEKYSMKMMAEVMKLNHEMKHLVSNTKLSALVTYPMTLLFAFDDVDMSNTNCFKIDQSDIAAVNKFVKGIYTNYASPEKEKKQIINDLQSMVKALKESLEVDDNVRNLSYLPEAVNTLMTGGFDKEIDKVHTQFIHENTDIQWPASSPDPQVKYLAEKFGVKKLKKIPADLVAYIQIETESIKDANDKMMIASYCLSKIEIVEWYIELLEVGSKKYIVPHTKQYLETVRTQLLQCYKEIMATKIPNSNDRPLIDIKYPKGYEG